MVLPKSSSNLFWEAPSCAWLLTGLNNCSFKCPSAGHVSSHLFSSLVLSARNHHVHRVRHLLPHLSAPNTTVTFNPEPHNTLSRWCPHWSKRKWCFSSLMPYFVWMILTVPHSLTQFQVKNNYRRKAFPSLGSNTALWDGTRNPVPEKVLHTSPTLFIPGSQILMQIFMKITSKWFPL